MFAGSSGLQAIAVLTGAFVTVVAVLRHARDGGAPPAGILHFRQTTTRKEGAVSWEAGGGGSWRVTTSHETNHPTDNLKDRGVSTTASTAG